MTTQDHSSGASAAAVPSDAASRRLTIGELLDRRRTEAARSLIGAALRENPQDAELLYLAARADWIDDRCADAGANLTQVLQIDPDHAGARWLMAAVLTEENELASAEEHALSLLRDCPRWPDLYVLYGRVMLRALLIEKAAALASEALRLSPDNADALRLRALCDLVQGVNGMESAAMERLLAEHPEDQATLATLAASLATAGRHREALRCSRQLLRSEPANRHWLRLTKELTAATHWSLWPLWPFQRYGWSASIVFWVASIIGLRLLSIHAPGWADPIGWTLLAYAGYSWIWPPVLRRWNLRD